MLDDCPFCPVPEGSWGRSPPGNIWDRFFSHRPIGGPACFPWETGPLELWGVCLASPHPQSGVNFARWLWLWLLAGMQGGASLPGGSVKHIQAANIRPRPAPGLARAEAVCHGDRMVFSPSPPRWPARCVFSPAPCSQPRPCPAPTPPHVQPVRALTTKLALRDFMWLLLAQAGCWRWSQM